MFIQDTLGSRMMIQERQSNKDLLYKAPKFRTNEIVMQEVDEETLVYDLVSNKAHKLSETLTIIWKHCDRETSVIDLSNILSDKLKMKINEDFIILAISELEKAELFSKSLNFDHEKISRRKILCKYELPTILMPLVVSIVAPQISQVADFSGACSSPAQCCNGRCGFDQFGNIACCPPVNSPCTTTLDCCEGGICDGGFCDG